MAFRYSRVTTEQQRQSPLTSQACAQQLSQLKPMPVSDACLDFQDVRKMNDAAPKSSVATFGYDQHGNMWVPSTTGIPLQGGTVATANNYAAATNRINGASYDAAGNRVSFTGSALTYDAENTGASQSGIGSMFYYYDGVGRRVQTVSTYNTENVFVYDAFGQLSAEYPVGIPAPPYSTCYTATDHLGSTRLVTGQRQCHWPPRLPAGHFIIFARPAHFMEKMKQ